MNIVTIEKIQDELSNWELIAGWWNGEDAKTRFWLHGGHYVECKDQNEVTGEQFREYIRAMDEETDLVKRFICLDGEKIGHVFVMRNLGGDPRPDLWDTDDNPMSARGHIVLMYVVDGQRDRRYGTEALTLLMHAMADEKDRLSINVLSSNGRAMYVYGTKLGFTSANQDERAFEGVPEMRQWMVTRLNHV